MDQSNIHLLTWGKLYSYIIKHGDLPVSIDLFPTNTVGQIKTKVQVKILTYFKKSNTIGLFLRLNTPDPHDFLWIPRLYANEIVTGAVNGKLYRYFYIYHPKSQKKTPPRVWNKNKIDLLPTKTKVDIQRVSTPLQTIYQKPEFQQKSGYDLYKIIEQESIHKASQITKLKRILIICGLEAYIKKKTTEWIKKLYPHNRLEIINTGESGQYYFMIGASDWPQQIKGKFDLIVLEFCPYDLFNYDNLHFLSTKLKNDGFVLFLYYNHRLFSKKVFASFIEQHLGKQKQKTLSFQVLDG